MHLSVVGFFAWVIFLYYLTVGFLAVYNFFFGRYNDIVVGGVVYLLTMIFFFLAYPVWIWIGLRVGIDKLMYSPFRDHLEALLARYPDEEDKKRIIDAIPFSARKDMHEYFYLETVLFFILICSLVFLVQCLGWMGFEGAVRHPFETALGVYLFFFFLGAITAYGVERYQKRHPKGVSLLPGEEKKP